MLFLKLLRTLVKTKNCFKRRISFVTVSRNKNIKVLNAVPEDYFKIRIFSSDHTVINNNEADYENMYYNELESENEVLYESAKKLLFPNSTDLIINELNDCASVEQVFNTLRRYDVFLKTEHVTQSILVLKDLQYMCYHYDNFNEKCLDEFCKNLIANEEFQKLLNRIKENLDIFDPELLSIVLLYLYKLGISVEYELMQLIAYKLRDHLENKFSLEICSRLFRVIFSENSSRPVYISLKIIPVIFDSIGK